MPTGPTWDAERAAPSAAGARAEIGVLSESYLHRGGGPALLGATIARHLAAIVARHAEREAVVSLPQRRRLRYAELADEVDRVAAGLFGIGLGRGDRLGVWATNNIEWLLLQLASARLGVVLVNINPAHRVRALAHALRHAEVQALCLIPRFRSSDYVAMLTELIPELGTAQPGVLHSAAFPHLRWVIVYDPQDPAQTVRSQPGLSTWQELLQAGAAIDRAALDALGATLDRDDPINIQYTSGTTGLPKAVELTHHNILNNARFSAQAMRFTADDRLAVPVPFYHCFGMVLANLLCVSVGACLVLPCEHFDATAVLQAIAQERCTALHGVPTMFIALLEHPRVGEFDLLSLRTGIMAGAPCPPALMRRVMDQLRCPDILIGYGQTEAAPLTHLTRIGDSLQRRTETVGTNLPHQEVKVVDLDSGQTLPIGQVGEVCFRGYHIMRGYYGDPEATAAAIDEAGWLRSGDLGRMDGDGYLQITGRVKEMIIRGGENIYPAEIEQFLFDHPAIAQVAVFGVPDAYYGEELVAWIRLHAGTSLDEDAVRDYCRGQIAHFKIPRYIRFVDAFPMTVTGKLQRFRMREMEMALCHDAAGPSGEPGEVSA